jgi:trimeric autotransporter adhesin
VSGSFNIVMGGFGAGFNIVAGSNNIYIGPGVSANGPFDESDTIRINGSAPAVGGSTFQVFFAGIDGSTVGAVNSPVLVNPNGQLGTAVSSARFKKDIDRMGNTSEAIFSLRPVTFHYKGDTNKTPQFGLIAEEVAQVNPALILVDKEGKPYSVRYEQINAMLLNELLKEHRRVQEQEATITELKKDFRATVTQLTTRLDEQAAQIQKVSAQLELSKPAPQTVLNKQ